MVGGAKFDDLLAAISSAASAPWAIASDRVGPLSSVVIDLSRGRDVSPSRLTAAVAVASGPGRRSNIATVDYPGGGYVAIVDVQGIALYNTEFQPFAFSTRQLAATMRDLGRDPKIRGILLICSTPGGVVTGVPEAAAAILAARRRKPVVAMVDPLAASAGYWIASQASEIAIVPSGETGSVGVFMLHFDVSGALAQEGIRATFIKAGEKKVDGNPYEPLGDRALKDLQAEVNVVYRDFLADVAAGRGVPIATVAEKFGKGRTVMARDALRAGMVDHIAAPADAIAAIMALPANGSRPMKALMERKDKSESIRRRLDLERLR